MYYGGSIFLIALGAILTFAVDLQEQVVAGVTVQWDTVGVILMIVGVLGIVWTAIAANSTRRTVVERERVPSDDRRI